MSFEHDNCKPANFQEDWPGQFSIFSWMAYVSAIPHVIYMATTLKDNGLPNACLSGWSSFTGEGDSFYVIMSGLMKHTHTYQNIKRDGEFCINFLSSGYIDQCKQSITNHKYEENEILAAGFTPEESRTIKVPRIQESFLKMECTYQWEKELVPNCTNMTVCGKVQYISASDQFVTSSVADRYGPDSFTYHLMAMKNPYTGERIRGGIGRIELTKEMEL